MKPDIDQFRLRRFVDRLVAHGECVVHDAAIELADAMRRSFILSQTGKTLDLLVERVLDGRVTGHTGSYIELTASGRAERGALVPAVITGLGDGGAAGQITDNR